LSSPGRRQRAVEGRSELRETLVVGTMNGDVDAKALLDAIDELLANPTPDIDDGAALAVAQDRRHGEDGEGVARRLDADDRAALLIGLHHRDAAAETSSP